MKKETFAKQAEKQILNCSYATLYPNDVAFNADALDAEIVKRLVVYSPTDASNIGNKFKQYRRLNDKTLNNFILTLKNRLDLENVQFFSSFNEKSLGSKANLFSKFDADIKSNICCLYLYIGGSGVKDSLFRSIRNAIAHGNIVKREKCYELFSVSQSESRTKDKTQMPITFFLRVYKLDKLREFYNLLEEYR